MVSTVDSYGIVYLESWLAGRPVIGNDNGQTRHVIEDGVDGYLVRANDPQLLAQRIEILLADPDRSTRMGEAGRRKVQERFGDHAVERRLHGIVRSLIG